MPILPDRPARFFAYLLPLCVISLASYKLNSEYSYWFDELYSVTAATTSFYQMMEMIFNDVHPPLYQIILWFWVRLTSNHEFAVRSLSFLFVIGASITFFQIAALLPRRAAFFSLVLFFSSWLIPYYAQESRAYAMLLFLTTTTLYFFSAATLRNILAESSYLLFS